MTAAALSPLTQHIAEESYIDVKDMIDETVRRFVRRHGGHYPDLRADADTAYVLGCRAWAEGRNNSDDFVTEIRRWVWFELFDAHRVRSQHRCKAKVVIKNEEFPEAIVDPRRKFDLTEFYDMLSPDAATVAQLVLDTPDTVAATARAKGGRDSNLRSTMRQHLRDAGWSMTRINDSFEEVRKAL